MITSSLWILAPLFQQLSCFPASPVDTDRAVLSFPVVETGAPSEGTLLVISGFNRDGQTESSGVLRLKAASSNDANEVRFQSTGMRDGAPPERIYRVSFSSENLGRSADHVSIDLTVIDTDGQVLGQGSMLCRSRIYEQE